LGEYAGFGGNVMKQQTAVIKIACIIERHMILAKIFQDWSVCLEGPYIFFARVDLSSVIILI
jgi:hypothetical protein